MADTGYKINVSGAGDIYWFTSTGKNGSITKAVILQPMAVRGRFNLAMADIVNGKPDFQHITNNDDLDQVFGAIAAIVKDFTGRLPGVEVYVQGSNAARTRLYRMNVANNLKKILQEFNVYGTTKENGDFDEFKKGENYIGILVSRK